MLNISNGDGGFEKNVLNDPEILIQWFPILKENIKKKLHISDDIIEDFIFYENICAVVKYQKNKKIRYFVVEQDLLLYNSLTNEVIAFGEIKRNYYDIPHADKQLIRNRNMLIENFESLEKNYPDIFIGANIIDKYFADTDSVETPIFTEKDFNLIKEHNINFIISCNPLPNTIATCSKISTQIIHWLYSSEITPEQYIENKIEKLIDDLNLRDLETIEKQISIFIVK